MIRERQDNLCACGCAHPLGARVEYDHEAALWADGSDDIANLRALRPGCHASKTAKEAGQRAKEKRIRHQDGLLKPKKSKRFRYLERRRQREGKANG